MAEMIWGAIAYKLGMFLMVAYALLFRPEQDWAMACFFLVLYESVKIKDLLP